MKIIKDYSYIQDLDSILAEHGYGEISFHSLNFGRYYNEEEKEENRRIAASLSKDEWNIHCEEVSKALAEPLKAIARHFAEKYDIHQLTIEKSSMEHYRTDWDLFYWSDKGWNNKDYMTCFSLSSNSNRSASDNNNLLQKIIPMVENFQHQNIACRIQYCSVLDKERIKHHATELLNDLVGKTIVYRGEKGKIREVKNDPWEIGFGFFKPYSRKNYQPVSPEEILAMKIQGEL